MTQERDPSNKPQIIKASHLLQSKVGRGPIDEATVRKCQEIMDRNTVDFVPLAKEYLEEFKGLVERARKGEKGRTLIEAMTQPVMQLKANAAVFGFPLSGKLARIMLSFIENIEEIDKDVLDIADVHNNAQNILIENRVQGEADSRAAALEAELKDACRRYFRKNDLVPEDSFFVDI